MLGKRTRNALTATAIAGLGTASLWTGIEMHAKDATSGLKTSMQTMVDLSTGYQMGTVEGLYGQHPATAFNGPAAEIRENFLETVDQVRSRGDADVIQTLDAWNRLSTEREHSGHTPDQITAMALATQQSHFDLSRGDHQMVATLTHAGLSQDDADMAAAGAIEANVYDGDHQKGMNLIRDLPVGMSVRKEADKLYTSMDKSYEVSLQQYMEPAVAGWDSAKEGSKTVYQPVKASFKIQEDDPRLSAVRAAARSRHASKAEIAQSPAKSSKGIEIGD